MCLCWQTNPQPQLFPFCLFSFFINTTTDKFLFCIHIWTVYVLLEYIVTSGMFGNKYNVHIINILSICVYYTHYIYLCRTLVDDHGYPTSGLSLYIYIYFIYFLLHLLTQMVLGLGGGYAVLLSVID